MKTHLELFQSLINDENISDNIDCCDEYNTDRYNNSIITMGFEGLDDGRKKGANGMLVLAFNQKGRLVSINIATCKKNGKDNWQVAASGTLDDFKHYFTKVEQ